MSNQWQARANLSQYRDALIAELYEPVGVVSRSQPHSIHIMGMAKGEGETGGGEEVEEGGSMEGGGRDMWEWCPVQLHGNTL